MNILKLFNSDILVRELFVKQTTTNGLYNPNDIDISILKKFSGEEDLV